MIAMLEENIKIDFETELIHGENNSYK